MSKRRRKTKPTPVFDEKSITNIKQKRGLLIQNAEKKGRYFVREVSTGKILIGVPRGITVAQTVYFTSIYGKDINKLFPKELNSLYRFAPDASRHARQIVNDVGLGKNRDIYVSAYKEAFPEDVEKIEAWIADKQAKCAELGQKFKMRLDLAIQMLMSFHLNIKQIYTDGKYRE